MHQHQWYQSLFEAVPEIASEAAAFTEAEGLSEYAGRIGTYQGSSGCPARLPN